LLDLCSTQRKKQLRLLFVTASFSVWCGPGSNRRHKNFHFCSTSRFLLRKNRIVPADGLNNSTEATSKGKYKAVMGRLPFLPRKGFCHLCFLQVLIVLDQFIVFLFFVYKIIQAVFLRQGLHGSRIFALRFFYFLAYFILFK